MRVWWVAGGTAKGRKEGRGRTEGRAERKKEATKKGKKNGREGTEGRRAEGRRLSRKKKWRKNLGKRVEGTCCGTLARAPPPKARESDMLWHSGAGPTAACTWWWG